MRTDGPVFVWRDDDDEDPPRSEPKRVADGPVDERRKRLEPDEPELVSGVVEVERRGKGARRGALWKVVDEPEGAAPSPTDVRDEPLDGRPLVVVRALEIPPGYELRDCVVDPRSKVVVDGREVEPDETLREDDDEGREVEMMRELPDVLLGCEIERDEDERADVETLGREIVRDPLERDEVETLGRETLGLDTLGRELGRETLGRETLGRETLGREDEDPRPRWASAGVDRTTRAARVTAKAARMR